MLITERFEVLTIHASAIVQNLCGEDWRSVICKLIEALVRSKHIDRGHAAMLSREVMRREELCSTAIGHGVAIVDLVAKKEIVRIGRRREPFDSAITPDDKALFVTNHLPVGQR